MSRTTSDALNILHDRHGSDPEIQAMVAEERAIASVSRVIYNARSAARITQAELAAHIGSSQSAMARLEDGDYSGHTIAILGRIAEALGLSLQIRLVGPEESERNDTGKPHISAKTKIAVR